MDLLWLRQILGSKEVELQTEIENLKKNVEALGKLLAEKELTDYPPIRGTISYADLNSALSKYAGNVFISDNQFNLTDKIDCKKFIDSTKVSFKKWVKENHDCDNFSFELMGYFSEGMYSFVFGIAWSATHAFNFFLDEDRSLFVVEPQTGQLIPIEEAMKNSTYYPWRLAIC